ncbi:MAG: hypothetical protein OEM49_14605 [Myxococcales bacterium]|nr:hypothetical protein [Myxococcales bacterium]
MTQKAFTARFCLATLVFAGAAFLAVAEAQAITYGEPDCEGNATNTRCRHPGTVSLSSFQSVSAATVRCSGTLLAEDANRFIILTAGHCVSEMLERLQDGRDKQLGVSFDAKIARNGLQWTAR